MTPIANILKSDETGGFLEQYKYDQSPMTQTTSLDNADHSPLRGGLLHRLLIRAGLSQPGLLGIRKRAGWLVCITFLPILVLSALQGVAYNPALKVPFLFDIAVISRFLAVGPLLILSEAIVEPWLLHVVKHVKEELIPEEEIQAYDQLIARTVRWRDSFVPEILLFISTFVWQWIETYTTPPDVTTTWYHLPASSTPTYAWFWYAYFAKPLLRFLWLRWLWQYLLWSFSLVRTSSFKLNIMPTHPDRNGGLNFIAIGHARFSVLAFTLGIQAASILGLQILFEGKTLMSFSYEIVGLLAIVLLVFLTPLLAFTAKLLEAKRVGLFEYGALADEYTAQFHSKWISRKADAPLLGTSDIQSLADLGTSYSIVQEMRTCLISKSNILTFATAMLLPFAPLMLSVYPFDQLLNHLLKAIL